jgi:arginyl-tRNA synthetase
MAKLPFASRKGWTVTMDDMLDLLRDRAYEETKKRNEDKDDTWLRDVAERIAITCFRFFLTKTDISKDITFDIDEVLDMEGETGAYVLYTNARIKAVLVKSEE